MSKAPKRAYKGCLYCHLYYGNFGKSEKLDEIPTITVTREHMSTRSCDLFFDDFRGE